MLFFCCGCLLSRDSRNSPGTVPEQSAESESLLRFLPSLTFCASIKEQHLDGRRSFASSVESKDDNKIEQETLRIANVLYSLNIESIPWTCV